MRMAVTAAAVLPVAVRAARSKRVPRLGSDMRTASEIQERIEKLESEYDDYDPPSSEYEDTAEVAVLRAIEELEWVLEEYDEDAGFTTS